MVLDIDSKANKTGTGKRICFACLIAIDGGPLETPAPGVVVHQDSGCLARWDRMSGEQKTARVLDVQRIRNALLWERSPGIPGLYWARIRGGNFLVPARVLPGVPELVVRLGTRQAGVSAYGHYEFLSRAA